MQFFFFLHKQVLSQSNNVTGQNINYTISGLDYEETYYVRTYLTGPNGTYYGNEISFKILRLFPFPIATVVVAHSPTPSRVNTIDSSKGDGKNALAAWL